MKKTILFLLLLATGCATTNRSTAVKQTVGTNNDTPPVYYNGNDEPAGFGVFVYADDLINDK
jgi:hypothetical protein